MESTNTSREVNVSHCSQCQGYTEYHCRTCKRNLCSPCKQKHNMSLRTKQHKVTLYKNKCNLPRKRETCANHPDQVYEKYCASCDIPVCFYCKDHRQCNLQNIGVAHQNKLKENEEFFFNISRETLYNLHLVQAEIKPDFITSKNEIVNHQSTMLTKAQKLKDSLSYVLIGITMQKKCERIQTLFIQIAKMVRYLTNIKKYAKRLEVSVIRPAKFLRFIRKVSLPSPPKLIKPSLFSLPQKIDMENLTKMLSEIQITERCKRKIRAGNGQNLLRMTYSPVLQKSFTSSSVNTCLHISFLTPERVWISDLNNLILTDTTKGKTLYVVKNLCDSLGVHTVNSVEDLIYVDKDYNINQLSKMKTSTLIKTEESNWRPMSVYCSPSGDLLVGMTKIASTNRIGKVTRYSSTGQTSQTIPADDIKDVWFKIPKYVTENNNGDIVVSDFWRGVVVIERGGELRFFFEGSNSKLRPYGICTDELSNILVCDSETNTVQIIDKDGQFLAYLLTLKSPRSLSYDVKNHSLWVGSFKSVSMYIYMDRDFDLIGKNTQFQY